MREAICAVVLCFLAVPTPAQVTGYRLLAGHYIQDVIEGHENGLYLPVTTPVTDTLWMWVEGLEKGETPSYQAASMADVVVWCYPQKHPDPRHALSGAEGKVAILYNPNRDSLIWVIDPDKAPKSLQKATVL